MNRLLRHVDAISRQRNRSELAAALAAALHDLLAARRVHFYKALPSGDDLMVGLVADADDTGSRTFDDGLSSPEGTMSIARLPHLHKRLNDSQVWTSRTADACHNVLELRHRSGDAFGFADVLTAEALSDPQRQLASGLLALAANCLALLDYSETDTLTGLLNRKTFDQYLLSILSRITTAGDPAAEGVQRPQRRHAHVNGQHWLAVVDVDHFKRINDGFGHLIGDEVLILLANRMRQSFRAQDMLFRFGGEEFVVLLTPTEIHHALAALERFRRNIENQEFPQVGKVTISIGFAAIGTSDTPAEILGRADEALYWAKENGRNRTASYQQLVADGSLIPHVANTEVELF